VLVIIYLCFDRVRKDFGMISSHMPEELLIFVGYSDDARGEAVAIRALEPTLQDLLKRLNLVASQRTKYRDLKVFNWAYDADLVVGGQASAISPHLERAAVAVFVFKERVGLVTWRELEECRSRDAQKRIPVIALFPQDPPQATRMNSVEVVDAWSNLLKKKRELTEDWSEENSRSITPVEPYRDVEHLKEILLKRLGDILPEVILAEETSHRDEISTQATSLATLELASLDSITEVMEYDSRAVQQYRSLLRPEVRLTFPSESSDAEFLRSAGYMVEGRLTAAGVLLFTSQPFKVFPSAMIRCTKFEGDTKVAPRNRRNCDGPLLNQIIQARDFVAKNIGSREIPVESSMQSRTIYQYPMICVREILANAVCHRNYGNQERLTYVTIYTDRIEIKSSGEWVSSALSEELALPISKLASESIQRNMRLAHAISAVDMMEMEGSGIPTSSQECLTIGAAEPTVSQRDGYVIVTIYPRVDWDDDNKLPIEKDLTSQHEKVLKHRSAITDTPKRTTLADWLGAKPDGPAQVTILFTDIIGSTKLSNKVGDKNWNERLLRHFNQGLKLITEHDGYKIKFIGESFMVAFKGPVSALKFAMVFHKDTGDELIKIRVCIHSGTARVRDDDIFGGMVNYAARLLAWKKDEGVIVSHMVKEDLDVEYGFQRAQEIFVRQTAELKDFRTQPVWALNLHEWWGTRIRNELPDIMEACSAGSGTGCVLRPATLDEVDWIAELQVRSYERDRAVPADILRAWYQANPLGFSIMEKEDGERIGHIDILPLKPAAVTLLLAGKQAGQAITPEMLYTPDEQSQIDVLYIESIIIKDSDQKLQAGALLALLTNFIALFSRICDVEQVREIFQIATSAQGERMAQRLGFRLIGPTDESVDQHPLYAAALKDIKSNIETMFSAPLGQ
jgi:class 3 adenylate cyclase